MNESQNSTPVSLHKLNEFISADKTTTKREAREVKILKKAKKKNLRQMLCMHALVGVYDSYVVRANSKIFGRSPNILR